ncbi:MAG: M23 family metallopeptidase [Bacteroidia bacterium]
MNKPKHTKWERIKRWLTTPYRMVVLNEETFGESVAVKSSPLGLITILAAITILMIILTISIIAFTPLREYIPGYGHIDDRKALVELNNRIDSFESSISSKEMYLNNLLNVFMEKVDTMPAKPTKDSLKNKVAINSKPSEADLQLRKEVEEMKNSSVIANNQWRNSSLNDIVFYSPVKGIVISSFNTEESHLGVDVVTKKDETIKAPLDGTVIYTGFTVEDGFILHLQHSNNLTTIYKHMSKIYKKTGERIKTSEVIGIVGSTGTTSSGPHLHFEIWHNGIPVNPEAFLSF